MKRNTAFVMAATAMVIGVILGYAGSLLLGPPRVGTVRNADLQVGDRAPDFRLPDHTGGYVRLSDYVGQMNVVIAFYPLAWTPVWSQEIPSLDADMPRFEEEDTLVLGISVDSTDTNRAWAESLGIEQVLLLSDFWPHGEVAQQYGVLREHGFTERATFIVDKEGIVRFAHIYDLNELPSNEELFQALQDINQ